MKYEVFARLNPGDETYHVGTVEATSDQLAATYARNTYDEEDWDRMFVVCDEDLVGVIDSRSTMLTPIKEHE